MTITSMHPVTGFVEKTFVITEFELHTGNIPYLDFIAPGILAQSVLFVAIFYGINVIWERDLGIVQKFLASPTPRAALVLGKGFSAGIRTLSHAVLDVFAHHRVHREDA